MVLPTIKVGGEEFIDMSSIVSPDRYKRPLTDGVAIHHTVGQTAFPDLNFNGTTMDEEVAHIKAIQSFHVNQGYGGFGYNGIAFESGRCYVAGILQGARAHVANHNNHLVGLVGAGTFTDKPMPLGVVLGLARLVKAVWTVWGQHPIKPHAAWVTDPAWATSCCGTEGKKQVPTIASAAEFILNAPERAAQEEAIKQAIRVALAEAFVKADLGTLAAQIAYLTGGKFCG